MTAQAPQTVPLAPFPVVDPRNSGLLDVGDGHRLYWEDCGTPDGIPVIYVHGGPGAGCAPVHRSFFDPSVYRVILFDQRGAGRSQPYAAWHDNTTAHLVADMEALRTHLGIDRWLLFGGSWGSTLALAYGQAHPQRSLGFILRGIFLFRQREVDWFIHGMGRFFPEAAAEFFGALSPQEQQDPLRAYYRLLTDPDPAVHGPAARRWAGFEDACARLIPSAVPLSGQPGPDGRIEGLAIARLEAHYMAHAGFLEEGQLLRDVDRIRHLPCTIVQGRYDVICPPETAADLHRAWPESRLRMVPDAGHSALEPGIRAELMRALQDFASAFRPAR